MSKTTILDNILNENNGYIKTLDAEKNGVSRTYFMEYVRKRGLERVSKGIYNSKDSWPDYMYEIQLRYPSIVFSHETALYLHYMAEREPIQYTVTMKADGCGTRLTKENVKVYKIKESLYGVGITECLSPARHKLRVYDIERTLCDILRSRSNIENQDLNSAFKNYMFSKNKDVTKFLNYAELFSVGKLARQYVEILQNG